MRDLSTDLTSTARALTPSAVRNPDPAELAPWLVEQVEASSTDDAQLAMWTSSTVIDDNLQAPVFDKPIFSWLHRGETGSYKFPIGHAGLMHTYGYLLSSVETPYGLKRTRWLTPDLANAFGLDPSYFYPTASTVPLMERVASIAVPVLTDPVGESRTVLAFDEVIDARTRMRTVYVCDPAIGQTAVVYGLVTGTDAQVVSTFPVQPLTAEWARGRISEPTRYRYNFAPLKATPGSAFDGSTEVLTFII